MMTFNLRSSVHTKKVFYWKYHRHAKLCAFVLFCKSLHDRPKSTTLHPTDSILPGEF